MIVELLEYQPPDGQQRTVYAEVPTSCDPIYLALRDAGGNLAVERLSTGEMSVTIEDREADDDYDIEIVPPRVSIEPALATMLERFDVAKFTSWKAKMIEVNQG